MHDNSERYRKIMMRGVLIIADDYALRVGTSLEMKIESGSVGLSAKAY